MLYRAMMSMDSVSVSRPLDESGVASLVRFLSQFSILRSICLEAQPLLSEESVLQILSSCPLLVSVAFPLCEGLEAVTLPEGGVISHLDLSCCPSLRSLKCHESNPITELAVNGCVNLSTEALFLVGGSLRQLDRLGACDLRIGHFTFENPTVTSIALDECPSLCTLDLSCPALRSLSLSRTIIGATSLSEAVESCSRLTDLDLSSCSSLDGDLTLSSGCLRRLSVENSPLTGLFLGLCPEVDHLTCAHCDSLKSLRLVSSARPSEVVLADCAVLDAASGAQTMGCRASLDMSAVPSMAGLLSSESSCWMSLEQLTLNDLPDCHALAVVEAVCPRLTSLSVQKAPDLESLCVRLPHLLKLNVSECTMMTGLVLEAAELRFLDVDGCSSLSESEVDLSACPQVKDLVCGGVSAAVIGTWSFPALEVVRMRRVSCQRRDIAWKSFLDRHLPTLKMVEVPPSQWIPGPVERLVQRTARGRS